MTKREKLFAIGGAVILASAFAGRTVLLRSLQQDSQRSHSWRSSYLPAPNMRWCTKYLKLKPFEEYVGESPVVSYVGLRADENRSGYISTKPNIKAVFPFKEQGIDHAGVIRILNESGIGLPPYLKWGRLHSGCYFCFFQRPIEWVNLLEHYPEYTACSAPISCRAANYFNWKP